LQFLDTLGSHERYPGIGIGIGILGIGIVGIGIEMVSLMTT
jgi:hypothetical protein